MGYFSLKCIFFYVSAREVISLTPDASLLRFLFKSWAAPYHTLGQPPTNSPADWCATQPRNRCSPCSLPAPRFLPGFLPQLEGVEQRHVVAVARPGQGLMHPAKTPAVCGGDEGLWEGGAGSDGAHGVPDAAKDHRVTEAHTLLCTGSATIL